MTVRMKRVYEPPSGEDGIRVLVDRLWPRGLSKSHAALDEWFKDVAPSPALRRSWHADPDQHSAASFSSFRSAYRAELREEPARSAVDQLTSMSQSGHTVTLVYAAKDPEINHVVVLVEAIKEESTASR